MKKYLLLSLITVLAALSYFYFRGKKSGSADPKEKTPTTQPGVQIATLTLADGSTVTLDSVNNKMPKEPVSTTVSTPRGGQYRLTLADGTKILLNAATSIRFPNDYGKEERKVELTGEAYFEVAKNPGMPFKVVASNTEILSLGTAFNVMAYPEENAIKTTLMEGSVRVLKNASSLTMKAGQQALVIGNDIKVATVDPDEEVAWRNGNFEEGNSDYLLRQIGRWHDLEIVYEGRCRIVQFEGNLSRSMNLTDLLQLLQASGLPASLDKNGRRIVVKGE